MLKTPAKYKRLESNWYVLRTRSRHEKAVQKDLQELGIENFLPVWWKESHWSDRKKMVEEPFFPGYIFVRIVLARRYDKVRQVTGAVDLVKLGMQPAKVKEDTIKTLKIIVAAEANPFSANLKYRKGDFVRVETGPLKGARGIVTAQQSKRYLQIYLDEISKGIMVRISKGSVRKLYR